MRRSEIFLKMIRAILFTSSVLVFCYYLDRLTVTEFYDRIGDEITLAEAEPLKIQAPVDCIIFTVIESSTRSADLDLVLTNRAFPELAG
jgi:hypothetical protein